jgi:hypothetical protein
MARPHKSGRLPPITKTTEVESPTMRWRRYLLIPVLPVVALIGIVLAGALLAQFPSSFVAPILVVAWVGSLYHAGRCARAGWVVGIAAFWPALVGYWLYVAFRLDSR